MEDEQSDPNSGVEGQEPQYEDDFEDAPEGTESDISENLSYSEKQDSEVTESGQGQTAILRSEELVMDDDNFDRTNRPEADATLSKSNISNIPGTGSSKETLGISTQAAGSGDKIQTEMEYTGVVDTAQQGSVSDDQEVNISADNYMELPQTGRRKSAETEELAHTVYDASSIISDVFEPSRSQPPPEDNRPRYNRYDDLRSKYTLPRSAPHKPDDLTLTYLPARGVRSYAPFLKSSPLAEFYRGDQVSCIAFSMVQARGLNPRL